MTSKGYFFKKATNSVATWIFVLVLNFLLFYDRSSEMQVFAQVSEYLNFIFIERFGPYPGFASTLDYVYNIGVYSVILLALSVAIAITLGVFLGTLASYKQGGKLDATLTLGTLVPFTLPVWWLALVILIYVYPTFPAFGWYSPRWTLESKWSNIFSFIPDFLSHLFLPLVTIVLALTGIFFLVVRNSLRNVYTENYITTAKAKGLSPFKVMFKHALRNAIIPVVSTVALTPQLLVLGIIMIETVFSRRGLGTVLMSSTIHYYSREAAPPTPLLQAVFVVLATITIILHFIVDVILGILDPRIRTDGAGLGRPYGKAKARKFSQQFHTKVFNFLKKFMRGYSGKLGFGVIVFFAIAASIIPYLPIPKPFPAYLDLSIPRLQPPCLNHLLGTDLYRRDMLAMILWGARASLIGGLGAVALALVIGCFVGLFSGYYSNRWIGYVLDRITDLFLSVPIIVIVVYFPMRAGPLKSVLTVGLTTWTITAKLVRAQVISAKEKPFIESSKALGAGDSYILFRHLLPECVPAVASSMLFVAVTALSIQSSLDYLGFERKLWSRIDRVLLSPYISWGTILSYGAATYIPLKQWWLMLPPGMCIALLCLALVAIGNKIVEITNPKLATYLSYERSGVKETR